MLLSNYSMNISIFIHWINQLASATDNLLIQSKHCVWLTDLRHFFGTQLVARGTDAATVRDLMGHSSLAVTSRYDQAVPAAAVRAVKGLSVRGHSGAVKPDSASEITCKSLI
jgi:site-specific recombinase XerD